MRISQPATIVAAGILPLPVIIASRVKDGRFSPSFRNNYCIKIRELVLYKPCSNEDDASHKKYRHDFETRI